MLLSITSSLPTTWYCHSRWLVMLTATTANRLCERLVMAASWSSSLNLNKRTIFKWRNFRLKLACRLRRLYTSPSVSLPFVFHDKNPCNRVYFPRLLVYNVRMSYCTSPLITVNTCIKRQPTYMTMYKKNECMNLKRSVLFFKLNKINLHIYTCEYTLPRTRTYNETLDTQNGRHACSYNWLKCFLIQVSTAAVGRNS